MIKQRPHSISYMIMENGHRDPSNGDWIKGKEVWCDRMIRCRYEPNGKANTIILPDGNHYNYSYVVYLDQRVRTFMYGEMVRLFDESCGLIIEKQVQGFHRGQLNARLWV